MVIVFWSLSDLLRTIHFDVGLWDIPDHPFLEVMENCPSGPDWRLPSFECCTNIYVLGYESLIEEIKQSFVDIVD